MAPLPSYLQDAHPELYTVSPSGAAKLTGINPSPIVVAATLREPVPSPYSPPAAVQPYIQSQQLANIPPSPTVLASIPQTVPSTVPTAAVGFSFGSLLLPIAIFLAVRAFRGKT